MRTRYTIALFGTSCLIFTLGLAACHSGRHYATHDRAEPNASEPPAVRDRDGFRRDIRSGTLTAGHFDDADDPARFADWAGQVGAVGSRHGFPEGFDDPAIQLTILNEHGDPVHDAEVRIVSQGQGVDRTLQSGTDGRCVILPGYDDVDTNHLDLVISADGIRTTRHSVPARPGERITITITLDGAESQLPRRLDLALVIDTTGSMGDELEFLKVEFRAIVERIAQRYPHVDQRWAVVVYRDRGDDYVVRDYDFTSSLGRQVDRLGEQRANGGGDYPEAVQTAFASALDLDWRQDSAKIAFLIADAPPHADRSEQTIDLAAQMRGAGIALYPVASSGVRAEAEYIFRAAALMTGGAYSFLTDDSGVGNAHTDPHEAPGYSVQRLDDLMVMLVESELAGQSRIPQPRDVVREVDDSDRSQPTASAEQLRDWRERRDTLANVLTTTELSAETRDALKREIAMLDRRIADAGH